MITNDKTAENFGNASFCKVGNYFYVMYSNVFGSAGNRNTTIEVWDNNKDKKCWTVLKTFDMESSNNHELMESDGKIYALAAKGGSHPVLSIFDGAQWVDTTVNEMESYYGVALNVIEGEVYIAYSETPSNQVNVLKKNGMAFEVYRRNIADGVGELSTATYGKTLCINSKYEYRYG